MKNLIKMALASIILMTSCSKDDTVTPQSLESTKFYASIEAPITRTSVCDDGKLSWSVGDEITIFSNAEALQYKYMGESDGSSVFEPVSSQISSATELTANYAIYPYDGNTEISDDGKISYTIPVAQQYAENSFGLGANVMVAVTENKADNFLVFKNLCGYFEFSLYGDVKVKSIEFKGNNNEKLAGKATITATHQDTPTFVFTNDATETLTLDCGDGVQLGTDAENATKFWFVVPAITYNKGVTITITDTEGKVMKKYTEQSIAIERSTVQPLKAFKVETKQLVPNNQIWYTSSDGKIVTPSETNVFGAEIKNNVYDNGKGVITFYDDITSVGSWAFYGCSSLVSILIPDDITSIGDDAFSGCSSLESIVLPSGVTSIGDNAFYGCSNIESVVISNKVASIGKYAFSGCARLGSFIIPGSVISVGEKAFSDCSSLTSVVIREGVTSIGVHAFSGCSSLVNVTIPESVDLIGTGAFAGCTSLAGFSGKYATADKRCLIIDRVLHSFAPANLTSYTIPEGVISIGENVFQKSLLIDITIPKGVVSIGGWAFSQCSNLTNVIIPEGVTSIGKYAFGACSNISTVVIPESVTEIGDGGFYYCSNLSKVYCKSINPPTLGANIFSYNKYGRKIYVPSAFVTDYKNAEKWSVYADYIFADSTEN